MTAAVNAPGRAAPVEPERWLLPVRPAKLICIGTNYHGHLLEMGTPPPMLPYTFLKPVSTGLVPSGTQVRLPIGPKMVDWEAELAIVIGRTLHGVRGPAVLDAVAGYTILNDLSARDWISSSSAVGIDWVLMKGYDGFSPIGPFITPSEFVPGPAGIGYSLLGQRGTEAGFEHLRHGFQRPADSRAPRRNHDPRTRRRHRHRDASRCRIRPAAPTIPAPR